MQKRGKKKLFGIVSIFLITLLVTSVLITASNTQDLNEDSTKIEKDNPLPQDIPQSAYEYVQNFAQDNGINNEDIQNVSQIDFNALPKEVNIENIGENNLAIYQIDYTKNSGESDKLFVITYSVEKLQSQGDLIIAEDKREFINFGFDGLMTGNGFLETATGVEGSLENGYVMMRKGSITGISSSFESLSDSGNIEVVIYKNGKKIQFGNSFALDSTGMKKDYDTQSKDTVSFEPGDVISTYIKSSSNTQIQNVVTLMEITTNT
jgi:hypothetical protein